MLYGHREVKNANTHLSVKVSVLRYIHFKFIRSIWWDIPGCKFLGHYGTTFVDSILVSCGLLWFRMPGGYSTMKKEENMYDVRWFVLPFEHASERGLVPCNSLQRDLNKRAVCRSASYPWRSARELRCDRTDVYWKGPQPPESQWSFWTPTVNYS
jgi:hypothetical protein